MKRMLLTLLAACGLIVPTLRAQDTQETNVVSVNGTGYPTLTAAFTAAQTMAKPLTITLLQDVDYRKENSTTTVAVDVRDVTIDLNQHTVTTGLYLDSENKNQPLLVLLGNFTLKNGTVQSTGSYGIFTGNVSTSNPSQVPAAKIEKVTVLDGGINVGSKVELIDVTATGKDYYAVWSEGDVTIKSGSYSSNGNAVLGVSETASGKMTIEGGTFTAKDNQSMVLGGGYGTPLIKGGTFNKDMAKENATLDETLQWKENDNGTWTTEEKPEEPPPEGKIAIKTYSGEGDRVYNTLQAAIDAFGLNEDDYMIELLADWKESVTIPMGKSVNLNLPYTLSGNNGKDTITIETGATLELWFNNDNGTNPQVIGASGQAVINNAGTLTVAYPANLKGDTVLKNTAGTVTLNNGKYEGNFEITGGTVKVQAGAIVTDPNEAMTFMSSSYAWCETKDVGWYQCATLVATTGGKNYSNLQDAIDAVEGEGTVKIVYPFSSTSYCATIPEGKTITLDLNGKTLQNPSSAKGTPVITNNGTLTIVNTATTVGTITQCSDSTGELIANTGTLVVEGGKFTPVSGNGVFANTNGGKTTVKGGTFNKDMRTEHATLGESLTWKENGDGTYTTEVLNETNAVAKIARDERVIYYATLQAAIDAAQPGETVTVLMNVVLEETLVVPEGYEITLDLNGKALTLAESVVAGASNAAAVMGRNIALTIRDTSSEGTGSISAPELNSKAIEFTGGTLNLKGGTLTGGYAIALGTDSVLNMTGGKLCGQMSAITDLNGSNNVKAFIAGGILEAKNQDPLGGSYALTYSLTGGTYNKCPAPAYCAEGFVTTLNTDGTYSVVPGEWAARVIVYVDGASEPIVSDGAIYATLDEAVAYAEKMVEQGVKPVVVLLRDVVLEDTVTLTKNLSIDLAGHTLYAPNPSTPAFKADSPVRLTVESTPEGGKWYAAAQKTETTQVTIDGISPFTATKWTDDGAYDKDFAKNPFGAATDKTVIVVDSPEKLAALSVCARTERTSGGYFKGITVRLVNDICLAGLEWEPLANFRGILDGEGHTLSGMNLATTEGVAALFAKVDASGLVKNLKIDTTTVSVKNSTEEWWGETSTSARGAVIAGVLDGTVRNCVLSDCKVLATELADDFAMGGVVAEATSGARIVDCLVDVGVTAPEGASNVGAFVGAPAEGMTVTNCLSLSPLNTEMAGTAKVVFKNVYAKNAEGRFVRHNTVDDPNAPSGELGEAAALNGIGWLLNGQKTEGALTWRVDSNEDCTTLLPFATATVATIPEVERYLTQDGDNYYANGHEAMVKQAIVEGIIVTVLQTQRDDYKVNEALTIAAPTTAVVYPGTQNGTVETATLTVAEDIQVCLDTVKSVTLKGTGVATLASASISAEQTVTLDGATLKVPGGVTLAVAGTVEVINNGSFIGTDGTSSVDVTGSVTGLSQGLSAWDGSAWVQAQIKAGNGAYYGTVAQALGALSEGATVTLLSRDVATGNVLATSAGKTVSAGAAYDVADVLGGVFTVTLDKNNTKQLVYAYDLGVGGLTIVKDAKGDLVVEVTVKLAEGGAAPAGMRTLAGCTLTVTSTCGEKTQDFKLEGLTFTDGECKVTIPYTGDNFPMGTNRLTVSISKGEATPPAVEGEGTL